jgi:hypothetical protein
VRVIGEPGVVPAAGAWVDGTTAIFRVSDPTVTDPGNPRQAPGAFGPKSNVENNRLMEQDLRARGYPAELTEVPDMHNYTAWRDAFHPHPTRLVRQVCG